MKLWATIWNAKSQSESKNQQARAYTPCPCHYIRTISDKSVICYPRTSVPLKGCGETKIICK